MRSNAMVAAREGERTTEIALAVALARLWQGYAMAMVWLCYDYGMAMGANAMQSNE